MMNYIDINFNVGARHGDHECCYSYWDKPVKDIQNTTTTNAI